ncbi:hypothetical protein [Catellatospora sichuanensis]|uniref:hypothetical protein n=1 Tax=Catellatospora sichuanensis TaxID=1969805 RepID=UPI0011844639|nr:hypothetical protein [Catellatospora sichuanensis]
MTLLSLRRGAALLCAAVALPLLWAAPAQAELSGPATATYLGYTDSRAPHRAFAWGTAPVPVGAWKDTAGRKHLSRVYVTFDLRAYSGSSVRIVILKVKELSGDCTRRTVELWRTAPISNAPTWANPPQAIERVAELAPSDYDCPGALGTELQTAFDEAVRRGDPALTLELRVPAAHESALRYGRTLDPAYGVPTSVFHDPLPVIDPTTLYNNFKPCATAEPYPYVTDEPWMDARGVDADDPWGFLNYEYQLWPADAPEEITVETGPVARFGPLAHDGAVYSWRVRARDYFNTSPWSPTCSFIADKTAPSMPTAVSPAYDPDTTAWVGGTATFTFGAGGAADVAAYQYTWSEFSSPSCAPDDAGHYTCTPPPGQVDADGVGGTATAAITAPGGGSWTLKVRSLDRAGNYSPTLTLYVYVIFAGPAGVSSDVYAEGGEPTGGVGVPGTFTFTPPAGGEQVVTYYYTLGAESGDAVPGPDGTASFTYTPTAAGPMVLNVLPYLGDDANGEPRFAAPYDYAFTVAG